MDKKEYPERVQLKYFEEDMKYHLFIGINNGVEYLRADKGEEVKEECIKECEGNLGYHSVVNPSCNPACHQVDINSIRQNVIIK